MGKKFIIGLGTGRCGTMSLALLLSSQPGIIVPHEYQSIPLPWNFSQECIDKKLRSLTGLNGDVGFYYLNYVRYINKYFPHTIFVCLERNKEAVVDSFLRKTEGRNHWISHNGKKWRKDPKWDIAFPKSETMSKAWAIAKYYDKYHNEINNLKAEGNINLKVFNVEDLNCEVGVMKILKFCGFHESEMNIQTGIKLNKDTR